MITVTFPEWMTFLFALLIILAGANEILGAYLKYLKWKLEKTRRTK